MNTEIIPATVADLAEISGLAAIIWRAHYPGIITPAQIDYMLARMLAVNTLRRELESGVTWFRALVDGTLRGFAAVGPTANRNEFKLFKLYVHPDWQRRGLGTRLLQEVEATARAHGAASFILNVNKRNETALAAYRQRGFTIRESVVANIGGGFVMDDYVMIKNIAP